MSMRRAIEMRRTGNPFKGLRNVGPATRADFSILGIATIEQLASSDPDDLYVTLQLKTGSRHDPCVWDVFAAAIHQARTGERAIGGRSLQSARSGKRAESFPMS
jgi:hypothetical protein